MRIELVCFTCTAGQIVDDKRRELSPRNGKVSRVTASRREARDKGVGVDGINLRTRAARSRVETSLDDGAKQWKKGGRQDCGAVFTWPPRN